LKVVEKGFPQTGQLLEAVPMPGIGDGQIEELQRPEEGQAAVFGVVLVEPIEGSFDLAPDIGQLFDQGESLPPADRERFVLGRRHFSNPVTA
jgi:hypothetical protein